MRIGYSTYIAPTSGYFVVAICVCIALSYSFASPVLGAPADEISEPATTIQDTGQTFIPHDNHSHDYLQYIRQRNNEINTPDNRARMQAVRESEAVEADNRQKEEAYRRGVEAARREIVRSAEDYRQYSQIERERAAEQLSTTEIIVLWIRAAANGVGSGLMIGIHDCCRLLQWVSSVSKDTMFLYARMEKKCFRWLAIAANNEFENPGEYADIGGSFYAGGSLVGRIISIAAPFAILYWSVRRWNKYRLKSHRHVGRREHRQQVVK